MSAVLNRNISLSKIGVDLRDAKNLEQALAMTGADYEVVVKPLYFGQKGRDGKTQMVSTGDSQATFRLDHKNRRSNYIATVGSKFVPLQNQTQFAICEEIAKVAEVEKPWMQGYVSPNGGLVTIRVEMARRTILGDEFGSYADVTNGHDGGRAARVCRMIERLLCANGARGYVPDFCLRANHTKRIANLREEVKALLSKSTEGLAEVQKVAEETVKIDFSEQRFTGLVEELLPFTPEVTSRMRQNVRERRGLLWHALRAEDLANFRGTGWAAVQAVSDFIQHQQANSKMDEENMVGRLLMNPDGDVMMKRTLRLVRASN